jgi:hypothetical protein
MQPERVEPTPEMLVSRRVKLFEALADRYQRSIVRCEPFNQWPGSRRP